MKERGEVQAGPLVMRYLTQDLLPHLWQEPTQALFSCPAFAVASSSVSHDNSLQMPLL